MSVTLLRQKVKDESVEDPDARISEAHASEFWERMAELVTEFDQLPRWARPCMDSRSGSIPPTVRPRASLGQPPLGLG